MTDTYATPTDLAARLSPAYPFPSQPERLLAAASELLDYTTQGRAQDAWDSGDSQALAALAKAACDQVEYWLEVGEEHDVLGLGGSLQGGRVQISQIPGVVSPRARRTLLAAGILWAGARAQ